MLFVVLCFFISYKPEMVNIEGDWSADKIVLNGNQLYPLEKKSFYDSSPQIVINNWTDSICISRIEGRQEISASFKIEKKYNGQSVVKLSSTEKSLNGSFNIKIDTTHIDSQSYRVHVRLQFKNTSLFFYKHIVTPPWKPEFPKRGQV